MSEPETLHDAFCSAVWELLEAEDDGAELVSYFKEEWGREECSGAIEVLSAAHPLYVDGDGEPTEAEMAAWVRKAIAADPAVPVEWVRESIEYAAAYEAQEAAEEAEKADRAAREERQAYLREEVKRLRDSQLDLFDAALA